MNTRRDFLLAGAYVETAQMTQEEKDAFIDTDSFNSYIRGYFMLTLQLMGETPERIEKAKSALESNLFFYGAGEAREAAYSGQGLPAGE